jgi:ankyrin repeat protein
VSRAALVIVAGLAAIAPVLADPQDDLRRAAAAGEERRIRAALKEGADPNFVYSRPRGAETALTLAITSGNAAAVRALIESGASVNWQRPPGMSPLMIAAERKDLRIARVLLDAGARSFWRDPQGRAAYEMVPPAMLLRRILEDAFLRDEPDLEKLETAPTIEGAFALLMEMARGLPQRFPEAKALGERIFAAARWLNNQRFWKSVPQDYKRSLTFAVYAFDKAVRRGSMPLLTDVARDLELKKEDCEARGPGAAGNDVDFRVATVAFPNKPAPGWIVRVRHALDFRLGDWERFQDPTDAVRRLPPGPYRMYVEHPESALKSCVENVPVSFRSDHFTFVIPAAGRNCK